MTIELWVTYKNEDSKINLRDAVSRFYCSFADNSDYIVFLNDDNFTPFFLFLAQHYGVFLTKMPDSTYHSDYNSDHMLEITL